MIFTFPLIALDVLGTSSGVIYIHVSHIRPGNVRYTSAILNCFESFHFAVHWHVLQIPTSAPNRFRKQFTYMTGTSAGIFIVEVTSASYGFTENAIFAEAFSSAKSNVRCYVFSVIDYAFFRFALFSCVRYIYKKKKEFDLRASTCFLIEV